MELERGGRSLTHTPEEPSSSVLTFALLVVGAQALNMPMGLLPTAHVAPTLAVTATSMVTTTVTV